MVLGVLLTVASFAWRSRAEHKSSDSIQAIVRLNAEAQAAWQNRDQTVDSVVSNGTTWGDMLQEMDIDQQTVFNVTEAASRVYNLRSIRPGNKFTVTRSHEGKLQLASYRIDPERELLVRRDGESFHAEIKDTPGKITTVAVSGTVEGSLFDSVIAAGEKPELAVRLAEIFAWDMDFNTDTQPGDTFRLLLERKQYADGSAPAYGRVSSHFTMHRYHPILKISRPHLGTDYAAPVGTPVQTIADGRVAFAGRKGGDGNMIKIAHSRGYETHYLHLSRILVRNGQSVHQGQRIGLVGMTGLATGPHLDFRIQQRGQFVNFERLKLPPANPVAKHDWAEFETARDKWMAMMQADTQNAARSDANPHVGTQ